MNNAAKHYIRYELRTKRLCAPSGFFHLSAAKQELNNTVQRVHPFQGDCGSQSERTSAK